MGEVIQFIPRSEREKSSREKSERERARLIREARAIYDSIFPADPVGEQQDRGPVRHSVSGADANRRDGALL